VLPNNTFTDTSRLEHKVSFTETRDDVAAFATRNPKIKRVGLVFECFGVKKLAFVQVSGQSIHMFPDDCRACTFNMIGCHDFKERGNDEIEEEFVHSLLDDVFRLCLYLFFLFLFFVSPKRRAK